QEEPEHASQDKLQCRHEQPALNQLPQARDEEAAEGRNHVSRRSLSRHVASNARRSSSKVSGREAATASFKVERKGHGGEACQGVRRPRAVRAPRYAES